MTVSPRLQQLLTHPPVQADRGITRHITFGQDAVDEGVAWFSGQRPGRDVILVADEHTFEAAGEAVEGRLQAAGVTVRRLVLEPRDGDDHVVCEDGVIRALATVLRAAPEAIPLAVGAGTVNDVVKMASHHHGLDYVTVPTAASMNGYTSSIAAVLVDGVKRTLPAQQPVAIIAATPILAAAPAHLTAAGFGDLVSKPVSNADWLLAHHVRGEAYSQAPSDLLDTVFGTLLESADAVGRADAAGIEVLMEAILLSGFSMAVAGTSAPASGGEHLVSHYWDMVQLDQGAPLLGLHGQQVGVATRASTLLYERLLALTPEAFAARAASVDVGGAWLDGLEAHHGDLSDGVVRAIRAQIEAKQKRGDALRAELLDVAARWSTLRETLAGEMLPERQLHAALRAAGCVTRASDLGVPLDRFVHTIRVCRHIRSRYVALDLIADLGLLDDWAAEVAAAVEADDTPDTEAVWRS